MEPTPPLMNSNNGILRHQVRCDPETWPVMPGAAEILDLAEIQVSGTGPLKRGKAWQLIPTINTYNLQISTYDKHIHAYS